MIKWNFQLAEQQSECFLTISLVFTKSIKGKAEERGLIYILLLIHFTCSTTSFVGAGLRWIQYMRPHTAFLEIGWKNWNTKYYKRFGHYQDIKSIPFDIPQEDVHVNWTSYSLQVREGEEVSEKDRRAMLQRDKKNHFDNHWKWADVRVPLQLFLKNLAPLYDYAKKSVRRQR